MNETRQLLVIDDDDLIHATLRTLVPQNWRMQSIRTPDDVPSSGAYHAAFVDMHFTKNLNFAEGPGIIAGLKKNFPYLEIFAFSGNLSLDLMESCLAAGARRFLAKPVRREEFLSCLEKVEALLLLQEKSNRPWQSKYPLIGSSPMIQNLKQRMSMLRGELGAVLIQGETGTGKEVVAQWLHQQEATLRPFVQINVAAISENLFESEMFGHVKGAFTGADQNKLGLAEVADGGDLFLDEIEALSHPNQVKLLRFLESGEVRRVGGKDTKLVQVRIIAATNEPLANLVELGRFREDLYFRLNKHLLTLPALRQRQSDIRELAEYFLARQQPRLNKQWSSAAFQILEGYPWPGNVRELKRVCEQVALLAPLPIIRDQDVAPLIGAPERQSTTDTQWAQPELSQGLEGLLRKYEKHVITQALKETQNIEQAAELINISRSSIYKKIKEYEIEVPS